MRDRLFDRLRRLSPGRQALLERLLMRRTTPAQAPPPIPVRDPAQPCPLTPVQARMWFLHQLDPGAADHVFSTAVRLRGRLDVNAFEGALADLVARHEVLRLAIRVVDGVAMQVFRPANAFAVDRIDLATARDGGDPETALRRAVDAHARRPLDPEREWLFHATLGRLDAADHLLLLTHHHLVSDGWTNGILTRELGHLYAARLGQAPPLPPLRAQFGDVVAWQHDRLRTPAAEDVRWWTTKLRGAPRLLELPADRPRPARTSRRGGLRRLCLGPTLTTRLHELARAEKATPYAVALAGLVTLLARYAARDDVVIGVPVLTRDRPELEDVVGPLLEALPVRVELAGVGSFRQLVARVRRELTEVYAHRSVSLERIVETLQPGSGLDHNPVFQLVVAWREPGMRLDGLRLPGVEVSEIPVARTTARFDLAILLERVGDQIRGEVEYATDLFEGETVDRMLEHLRTLLAAAAANPDGPLARLPLMTVEEREQRLRDWRPAPVAYPRDRSLPALFAAACDRDPGAVAVVMGEARLTYGELAARAARLARRLRARGVGPEVVVGVCLERSLEMVVGLLAVLQAGGAYLPLDPADPPERLALLLADARADLVLTRARDRDRLGAAAVTVVAIDTPGDDGEADPAPDLAIDPVGADRLAYVMYTSGSTGRPKGVEVPHRAVVRLLFGVDYVSFGPGERILQVAPLGFDASTFEIWGALLHGGTCVLHPECVPTAAGLGRAIGEHEVTTLFLTTALFNHVVDEPPPELARLRHLLAGGEPASAVHFARARAALPATRLVNAYGPTEGTTFATCHEVTTAPAPGSSVPIGRPLANSRVYLLDAVGEPVPVGVPGEIHIGGDGLARGYRNQPALTAERFVADPFAPEGEGRLYRTGDLARARADGVLEFVGRRDQQLKVRGFRVEPAEVEAALTRHADVARAAVVRREDRAGDARLVAYVVPRNGVAPTGAELRAHLLATLPRYMVPSTFVALAGLPLNGSGKVDRAALPAPPGPEPRPGAADRPRTPVEELVAGIWAEALGHDHIGRHEEFFELGGHSLLAIQVVARLRQALDRDVPAAVLFEAPTIAELGARLEALIAGDAAPIPAVRPVDRDRPAPLSLFQERTWRHAQSAAPAAGRGYTHTRAFALRGALDVTALADGLTALVRRHEILRTTYRVVGRTPVQVVEPPVPIAVPVVDLRDRPDAAATAERVALVEADQPLDLGRAPLLRARVLRLADAEAWLLLTLHHIAYDAESLAILFRELGTLYDAAVGGAAVALPEPALRYVDYARWQRERLQPGAAAYQAQLDYWRRWLEPRPARLRLPRAGRAAGAATVADSEQAVGLGLPLRAAVATLAREERATVSLVFLAALQVVLSRYADGGDFVLGLYGAQRGLADLEGVVGCFVGLTVLRARVDPEATFRDVLRRVRAETLGAYASQELPFEEAAAALPALRRAVREIPAIFVSIRARPETSLALAGLTVTRLRTPSARMPWGLTVVLDEAGGVLGASFDARRYEPAWVRGLLEAVHATVERAVAD
jgi:amino acid adenylation domain-containing protein